MTTALFQAPPAFRRLHAQTGLTSTHLLAGAGGDTLGLFEAGYLPLYAANHEPIGLLTATSPTGRRWEPNIA